ncbi:hypothetical protein [Wukongibacter sp. M2B1]|uniref:hypothetical protein n=1 Tax=Wukongibacter sp. M2B1 TaxID=3088895 RepID=UPI003D7B0D6B
MESLKIFKLDDEEYMIARTKGEALEKIIPELGIETILKKFQEYLKINPDSTHKEFIDSQVLQIENLKIGT